MLNLNKRKRCFIVILLAIVISIVVLFSFFINTHDDYWIPFGISVEGSVKFAADIGNGRYVGNFLGNYLSQRTLLNNAIKSVCFFLIILLLADNSTGMKLSSLIISAVLLIYPSKGMFGSCYIWSHCYYNYVLPIFFWLISLSLLRKNKKLYIIPIILAAILQMLCSENTSIIIFLAAIIILVYNNYLKGNICSKEISAVYIITSFVGLIIIFVLPKIMGVSENVDFYRDFPLENGLLSLIKNAEKNLFYICCYLEELCILWPALIVFLLLDAYSKGRYRNAAICLSLYLIVLIIYYSFDISVYESRWYIRVLYSVAFMAFQISLIFSTIISYKTNTKKLTIIYILAILSEAELMAVSPIGTRCLYITYILYSMATVMLYDELIENDTALCKKVCALFGVIYIICCSVMIPKMKEIHELDKLRLELIRAQLDAGQTTISVISLPDDGLLWIPNGSYAWSSTFNQGDPDEMTFNFYPPEVFNEIISSAEKQYK